MSTPTETMKNLPRYCSDEGPECPYCGCVHTADEPYYFNEYGFEMECNDCGRDFKVWPNISVTWRTESIANTKGDSQSTTKI